MIEPNQGHPVEGYRWGGGQTHPQPIYTNVISPAPLTQGDQAHNSEIHTRGSWWPHRSKDPPTFKTSQQKHAEEEEDRLQNYKTSIHTAK